MDKYSKAMKWQMDEQNRIRSPKHLNEQIIDREQFNICFLDTKNRIVKALGMNQEANAENISIKLLFDEIGETNATNVALYVPRRVTVAEQYHLQKISKKLGDFGLDMLDMIQEIDGELHSYKQEQFLKTNQELVCERDAAFEILKAYQVPQKNPTFKRKQKERFQQQLEELYPRISPDNLKKMVTMCQQLVQQQREHFVCFDVLETEIQPRIVFVGSRTTIQIDRFEVLHATPGTKGIVLAHNHPSGDFKPSEHDIACTKQLAELGKELGITIYDHLVIGQCGVYSLAEQKQELKLAKSACQCEPTHPSQDLYEFCQIEPHATIETKKQEQNR